MEVILKGEPKEIAALVLAVQERQDTEKKSCVLTIDGKVFGAIDPGSRAQGR